MIIPIILVSLIILSNAVSFSFHLNPGQSQCFYEMVERSSRFQILIRSSIPEITVNIFTPTGSVSKLIDPDTFQKSYAGFSDDNDQVHFCLSNPTNHKSKSLIQFYHGLNLESVGEVITTSDFMILKSANQNLRQIIQLLKQNFNFYNQRMRGRVLKHEGVGWSYNIITIMIIVVVSGFSFYHVFSFRRFLRNKKYI